MADGVGKIEAVPDSIANLGPALDDAVRVPLEAADKDHLPQLREIDQALYTSVTPALAVAYTLACGYMHESIVGAAECFTQLRSDLEATAETITAADEESAALFK